MNPVVEINQTVDVIVSFRRGSQLTRVMPRRMRYHGQDINLTQLGLCYPVRRGHQLYYIFNTSDDNNDYSLEFNTATLTWTLLSMVPGDNR